MKVPPASYLRRKRKQLSRRLPSAEAVLRGSLVKTYKRCGKPGCKCAQGQGHGPKYYLSVSLPGRRPQMDYVPQEYQKQVEDYLANIRLIREILEEICNINRELLRRRKKL